MHQITRTFVLILYTTTFLAKLNISKPIFGGKEVTTVIPYHVLLQVNRAAVQWTCSGSIITQSFILTSASCTATAIEVTAYFEKIDYYAEDPNKYSGKVKNIIIHPDYLEKGFENDLALLELEKPVNPKSTIKLLRLAHSSDSNDDEIIGPTGFISGWGTSGKGLKQNSILKILDVKILNPHDCANLNEIRQWTNYVCATGGDNGNICPGDSGSPLVIVRKDYSLVLQVGIVSYGLSTNCTVGGPHMYTKTLPYMKWILKTTGFSYSTVNESFLYSIDDWNAAPATRRTGKTKCRKIK